MKGQLENSQRQARDLEREVGNLREEVRELQENVNQGQNCVINNEHQKNKAEIEILDLRKQLANLKEDARKWENEATQSRQDFEQEKSKTLSLTQQNERMRALVENLDKTKEDLMRRLQSSSNEKTCGEQDRAVLLQDMEGYKRELLKKEGEISDLRRSVEALD